MDLGLLGGLSQGLSEGINNYVNLSGTLQQRKTAEEDALAKRKQAVIDNALKKAQMIDLVGEDAANKLFGTNGSESQQSQPEQPAWKQLLASNEKPQGLVPPAPSGLVQPPQGLVASAPNGDVSLQPKRVREALRAAQLKDFEKQPIGKTISVDARGNYQLVDRPLTIDESTEREQKQTQLAKAKADLKKAGEEDDTVKPDQSQAALYGKRMLMADDLINKQASEGFNRSSMQTSLQSYAPNMFKGAQLQKQEQAERDFVNAILRKESGSAISKDEFSSAEKQYFPRNGDTPDVIAQKAQNRALAIDGMKLAAGNKAWKKLSVPSLPTKSSGPQNKPKTVIQNGHTYTLNPKTWNYE